MYYDAMDKTDPREEKLPRWALRKLDTLRMRVHEARSAADATLGHQNPRDNAWLQIEGVERGVAYLPSRHRTVRFYTGADDNSWIEIAIRDSRDGVDIRTSGEIVVRPIASNLVAVKAASDYLQTPPKYLMPWKNAPADIDGEK